MKLTQYVQQEKVIAAADSGSIRERILWGLRILDDPEFVTGSGKSLKHGAAEKLIAAAKAAGQKLSEREIRRRMQGARAYPTDTQIGHAVADFRTWRDLADANFPAYDAPPGEPPADYRSGAERRRDRNRIPDGDQYSLFPLDKFEPAEATLKALLEYTDEQDEITARYVEHGRKRRAYLDRLIVAAKDDLSMTWAQAESLLDAEGAAENLVDATASTTC